ncbi:MAG TPA: hypothetical protein VJ807_09820 [Gaiellaceae bacterium]|nr:hypothetical protein [Gaiellaceae bacterium]
MAAAVGVATVVFTMAATATTGAHSQASRIIDRTFVCTPAFVGGVYKADTRAYRRAGRSGSSWAQPAFADISTGISGAAYTAIKDELAWVTAGKPTPDASVVDTRAGYTFPMRTWGTIGVNREQCRRSTKPVAFGRSGLRGSRVGMSEEAWDCFAARRVLVRVRAVMTKPAGLTRYIDFLRTTVPVTAASLAMQTSSGKRLVFAQLLESGDSLLYTSPDCFPD